MSTTPTSTSTLERDMREVYLLRRSAAADLARADEILSRYTFDEDTAFSAGDFIVRVNRTRRFDAGLAKKNLTPEQYAATLVTKPDSTLAKKVLSEDDYRASQREYGWTIKVEEVTDDADD